jgi:hypothetical protein
VSPDILIFLAWANFYLYGLWDDIGRAELNAIAKGEKHLLPWLSEKEPLKSRWFPNRLEGEYQDIILRQHYGHWFNLCYKSRWYYVDKNEEKGLLLKCKYAGGIFTS